LNPASPSRAWLALIGGGGALLLMAGFGAIFYVTIELLDGKGVWAQRGATALALLWSGFVIWAMLRVQALFVARNQQVQGAQIAAQRDTWAREVEALATRPQWRHWAPLIRRWRMTDAARVLQWETRYRALLGDPRRSSHAARTLDGHFPSDAQIDYGDDPAATATCEHLVAIERDLRAAGLTCTLDHGATRAVVAEATLRPDALREQYALPEFVRWQGSGRHPHDDPSEYLSCTRCPARIESRGGPAFPPAAR
jgi:hypothetical protein